VNVSPQRLALGDSVSHLSVRAGMTTAGAADTAMYAAQASGRGRLAGVPSATLRNPKTLPSQKAQLAG